LRSSSKHPSTTASRRNGTLLRRLQSEVELRKAAQDALAASERHYGTLLEKSRHMQEQLRRLSHEVLTAQEEERKKISRDLHDQIGQTLTAINVRLTALNRAATLNASSVKVQLAGTQRLLERSMDVVHRFARDLRPAHLDDLGLTAALRSLVTEFAKRTQIPIRVTVFAGVEQLGNDKKTVLYRVAQEALTNIAKHAKASLATVKIARVPGAVRMEVHDNGRSFRAERILGARAPKRLGLLGMRERAEMLGGTFSVDSAVGEGTTIRIQIPFDGVRRPPARARAGARP